MAKRKKPKKKKSNHARKVEKFINLNFFSHDSPFHQFDNETIEEITQEIQTNSANSFLKTLYQLKGLLSELDPLTLLTHFSFYDLILFDQVGFNSKTEYEPLSQSEVEILQAFLLACPYAAYTKRPPRPNEIQTIHDQLKEISRNFFFKRYAPQRDNQRYLSKQLVAEMVRGHTQSMRHCGTLPQVYTTLKKLMEPIDNDFERLWGVKATALVKIMNILLDIAQDRLNGHVKAILPLMKLQSLDQLLYKYMALINTEDDIAPMKEFLAKNDLSVNEARIILSQHYCYFFLPEIFTFSLDEQKNLYSGMVSLDSLKIIFGEWSFSFGDLKNWNSEHLFLDNPIWTRPFIKLEDNCYFLPILPAFQAFGLEMFESLIEKNKELKEKYHDVRAKQLEDTVFEKFKSAFPDASLYRNNKYIDQKSSEVCENDLLVIIDSYAIIIECKSGHFTPKAKRGHPSRLERDIEGLIEKPAKQALRFANFLKQYMTAATIPLSNGTTVTWENSPMKRIIPICITFELLGPLSGGKNNLVSAGLIGDEEASVLSIALPDLENIFEILKSTISKLHYFERRSVFATNLELFADEMDLLVFYLDNGFNIGETEYSHDGFVQLYGISNELNEFLLRDHLGYKVARPVPKLTKWWKDLLSHIESRKVTGWTILGNVLLNVAYEDQKTFEKDFKKIQKNVGEKWHLMPHQNMVVLENGPTKRQDIIVGLAVKNVTRQVQLNMVNNAINVATESSNCRMVLVIIIDIEKKRYPYQAIYYAASGMSSENH
jgi:hypothetical protein